MLGKNIRLIGPLISIVVLLSIGLSGCDKVNSQEMNTIIKPVKLIKIPDLKNQRVDSFIGKLDATERALLSFNVAGEIASQMPLMGAHIRQGEVLAFLDPSDYQLALDASQAEFSLATTQFLAAKELVKNTLISTDQFDQRETNFKVAKAKLALAKSDLADTEIIAPFDGIVSITNARSHQVVAPNQAVMKVLNNKVMDVSFTIPVNYVSRYGVESISRSKVWVSIDSRRDLRIEARFKEISTQANEDTNSYTARVTISGTKDLLLLTDMNAQVHLATSGQAVSFRLPETAWISRSIDQGYVWKFDSVEQRIARARVFFDEQGNITSGLQQGDLVVETGIHGLSENQQVKAWIKEAGI